MLFECGTIRLGNSKPCITFGKPTHPTDRALPIGELILLPESRASVVLPGCARLPRGGPGFFVFRPGVQVIPWFTNSRDLTNFLDFRHNSLITTSVRPSVPTPKALHSTALSRRQAHPGNRSARSSPVPQRGFTTESAPSSQGAPRDPGLGWATRSASGHDGNRRSPRDTQGAPAATLGWVGQRRRRQADLALGISPDRSRTPARSSAMF